jgi:hypothetical protein
VEATLYDQCQSQRFTFFESLINKTFPEADHVSGSTYNVTFKGNKDFIGSDTSLGLRK